ncbi:MAG: DUF4926 domain-containing protein [Rhizomicrobium sp.]|jgi:hypothetical protein
MTEQMNHDEPLMLDVVALLADLPVKGLVRGQVGTVIESLDAATSLVEFSDEQGRAFAVAPCPRSELLVLHYATDAAA